MVGAGHYGTIAVMRWSDRPADPAPREARVPDARSTDPGQLARRLDALPTGHPSSSDYDLAAAQDADGAAAGIEEEGLAADDSAEYGAPDGAEQAAADGQDRQGRPLGPGPADLTGRHPASRAVGWAKGEPYRPWFTDGGPAEPWFTADPGGPPG